MDIQTRKNYENDFYNIENYRTKPIRGILIYEDARKKLGINQNGKLYSQKWFSYIPFIGPTCSLIYANLVLAKTKCLRYKDMIQFKNINKFINIFGFLAWPLLFLMFWTLLTFISIDYAGISFFDTTNFFNLIPMHITVGHNGDYYNLWHQALINQLQFRTIVSAGDFFNCMSIAFAGLFYIFIFPLISTTGYIINNCYVNTNLIFILCFIFITFINPINIFNSCTININRLRFIVVYEASSVYRYRAR